MSNTRQELVDFYGDQVIAIKEPNDEIYVVINNILKNVGFVDQKIDNVRRTWAKDMVLSEGIKILTVLTKGGMQQTTCINIKYFPLALASISITPTMQREQPEIVEKLVRYKLECAGILYKYFFGAKEEVEAVVSKTDDDPVTREEFALFFKYTNDMFVEFLNTLNKRDKELGEYFKSAIDLLGKSIVYDTRCLPVKNTNMLLENTLPEKDVSEWINQVWMNARKIGERAGKPTQVIFGEAYKIIRKDTDFDNLYGEYSSIHGKAAKITMCANSDYLRKKTNCAFNVLARKYFPEKYGLAVTEKKKELSRSYDLRTTPDKVRNLINEYAKKNNLSYTKASMSIYRQMTQRGRNINKEVKLYAKSIGYSKCCNGYYVSVNPDLMDLLKKITEA